MYSATSLYGSKTERIHCARLINYKDSLHGSAIPKEMLDIAERSEARFEFIEKIIDIGEAPDGLIFHFAWERLPDKRDWTCQPAAELFVDIP